MHPRRVIRGEFKALLLGEAPDYATDAQDRVFATMAAPQNVEDLVQEGPVICLYAGDEEIRPEDYPAAGFDGAVKRTLTVSIEALVCGADADDKADDMAEAIEALVESWVIPSYPAAEIRLTHTQIDVTDGLEVILGGVLMTYEVKYWRAWRPDNTDSFLADDALINGGAGDPVAPVLPPIGPVPDPVHAGSPAPPPGGAQSVHGVEVTGV